jgi:hypothetical protein
VFCDSHATKVSSSGRATEEEEEEAEADSSDHHKLLQQRSQNAVPIVSFLHALQQLNDPHCFHYNSRHLCCCTHQLHQH